MGDFLITSFFYHQVDKSAKYATQVHIDLCQDGDSEQVNYFENLGILLIENYQHC